MIKEDYYKIAVQSLIKKSNFCQLSLELEEGLISGNEYEKEIEKNPEKYVIELTPLKEANHLYIISEIVKDLGIDFSIDEVADLFAITPDSLNNAFVELKL